MKLARIALALAVVLAAASGCSLLPGSDSLDPVEKERIVQEVVSSMDASTDPCQDFYRYACGGWLDATEIPPDRPHYGRSFSAIDERNRLLLRGLLEDPGPHLDPARAKAGAYYASCMDEAAIESAGRIPLEPWLQEIERVDDAAGAFEMAGRMQWLPGASPFLGFGVGRSLDDPDRNLMRVTQGGLGLPDRDYYLGKQTRKVRDQYRVHVEAMMSLAGASPSAARADAAAAISFETELARISKSRTELRDVEARHHEIDRPGLEALDPKLEWDAWFAALGAGDLQAIDVADPEFFSALGPLLRKTPPGSLRAYLRWQLVDAVAGKLSSAFVDESFRFRQQLSGQAEISARWRRCLSSTERAFPDLVGRIFVDAVFSGDSKEVALEMVEAMEVSFETGLPELAWMDAATRAAAVAKAREVGNKIGYPNEWRDYAEIPVDRNHYFENTVAVTRAELGRELGEVGQPVDPDEWHMPASAVNAYYAPSANEIVFPAGILQAPFFDRRFPRAMNYGAIGAVIGHELTHGFDDQGRKFDGQGRLHPWWEPAVAERFEARAQCLVDQYDALELRPGLSVNGQLTLGENIADLGGIKLAHRAWQAAPEPPFVPGLSGEQLLFVAYGQAWCRKSTPEFEELLLRVDSHAPARFRVNGVLANLPAFAEAFACEAGTPMRPADACEVW